MKELGNIPVRSRRLRRSQHSTGLGGTSAHFWLANRTLGCSCGDTRCKLPDQTNIKPVTRCKLPETRNMLEHEKIELSSKKRKTRLSKSQIHQIKKRKEDVNECKFHLLTSDSLEHIACYLDTKSALALMRTSKTVRDKLMPCVRFWKSLCKNENFHEYTALKTEDKEDEPERLSWSGEKFHEVDLPSDATMWNKIFLRGMQMMVPSS